MASSSDTPATTSSGGSYPIQNLGSDEDIKRLLDERKRKRMDSNRESAKRSRMRKQKHIDDLTNQASQLKMENHQVMTNVSMTMQHYTNVEAENSVLRARVVELSRRLESLNQIISVMNQSMDTGCGFGEEQYGPGGVGLMDEFMNDSLGCFYTSQPILASANMI
uniref:bZIP transcription factor 44-like n=1 Tax=Erigeron canadensis TaxID=72917 RepID=UPI001CB8C61E|nr:bZIP transcription factor 44-like [Erigeron canadensis]